MEKIKRPSSILFHSIYLGSVKGTPIALLTITILTTMGYVLGTMISQGYLEALKYLVKFVIETRKIFIVKTEEDAYISN